MKEVVELNGFMTVRRSGANSTIHVRDIGDQLVVSVTDYSKAGEPDERFFQAAKVRIEIEYEAPITVMPAHE